MPASNLTDLIAAALRSGQLSVTSDAIEFTERTSRRIKNAMLAGLFPGEQAAIADRFRRGDDYRIPVGEMHENVNKTFHAAILKVLAQEEIKKAWERSGGAFSPVGLPLNPKFPVSQVEPGTWALQCRSGRIQYVQDDRKTFEIRTSKVTVRLVAIECQVRQESSDEVYGVVSVHGPANRLIQTVRVPASETMDMGEEGARLTFPNVPLVTDNPVEDLYLRVAWIENDSGNEEDIARKVADKLREAASAAAGALVGAGAESVTASQDETFYEASLWVVGEVLGMGDDAYPVEGKFVSAGEQMSGFGPPMQPTYLRGDDPRPVDRWTHDIIVQGVDDGGDLGRYRFFFEVSRADILETKPI